VLPKRNPCEKGFQKLSYGSTLQEALWQRIAECRQGLIHEDAEIALVMCASRIMKLSQNTLERAFPCRLVTIFIGSR
jgi:hypothetical protein